MNIRFAINSPAWNWRMDVSASFAFFQTGIPLALVLQLRIASSYYIYFRG